MKLKRGFFERQTLKVAQDLLGKFIVHKIGRQVIRAQIIETEAYVGETDKACHASRGRTPRTEVMYGQAGHAYIYMVYGMYFCLNVVTEKKDFPAAVLIRGIRIDDQRIIGPGRTCKFLKINKALNKQDLITSKKIWLEDRGIKIRSRQIKKDKRVGIDYAGKCKHYLWRFILDE